MTRTLPAGLALVCAIAVTASAARAPRPETSSHELDLARKNVTQVYQCAFSPNGRRILVQGGCWRDEGNESALTMWEAATGRHLWTLRGDDAHANGFDFSPDGKHFALSSLDSGAVVVRDAADGTKLRRLTTAVSCEVRYSPDGKHLVTYCREMAARRVGLNVVEVASGRTVYDPDLGNTEWPQWYGFAADGRLFFVTSSTRLRTWHPRSGAETVTRMNPPLWDVCGTDAAGTRLLGWGNESLTTVDVTTGLPLQSFGTEKELCGDAYLTADGSEVVSARKDGRVVAWDSTAGAPRTVIQTTAAKDDILSLSSPGVIRGRFLVCRETPKDSSGPGAYWGAVYTRDGRLVREERDVTGVVFDTGGRWVAVRKDVPATQERAARSTVTIHDAAAWLAGGAKMD